MNTLNPFALLDNILADWASPRVRRLVHFVVLIVVALVAAWFAADGDWVEMAVSIGGALYAASNRANTPSVDLNPAGTLEGAEKGSYEGLGGNPYPETGSEDYLWEDDEEPVSGN